MPKILALTVDHRLTYCEAPPERRGIGKCNHIAHIKEGQEISDFLEENGVKGEVQPYRMSIMEKSHYMLINGRKQLADPDCEGGYIELEDGNMVWSPANLIEFSNMCKYTPSYLRAVINGKKEIKGFGTGVEALNKYAESQGYTATTDIYVIPYRYREDLDNAKNPINALYNAVITSRKDPQKNQEAYDRLLNNEKVFQKYGIQPLGHRGIAYQSLGGRISGKKGIMRGLMSGYSVRDSAHLVITPCKEIGPDEVGVPPHICAELWKSDLYSHMTSKGASMTRTRDWLERMSDPNNNPSDADIMRLDNELQELKAKCLFNRAPSLHNASMVGCYVRVNGAVETNIFGAKGRNYSKHTFMCSPTYYKGQNADNDGDTMGISKVYADEDAFRDTFTTNNILIGHNPKNIEESLMTPTKDSLFGLLNLLMN